MMIDAEAVRALEIRAIVTRTVHGPTAPETYEAEQEVRAAAIAAMVNGLLGQ